MKTTGTGTVLPGAPVASLPSGKTIIKIDSAPGENDGIPDAISENVMAKCVYPDGFTRNHQTKTPQDLVEKVINLLRNRYGVTGDIKVIKLPKTIAAGATIELEV